MWKTVLLILVSVALGVAGQVSLKQGMTSVNAVLSQKHPQLSQPAAATVSPIKRIVTKSFALLWQAFLTWKVIFGIGLYAMSMITWLLLISRVDLSFAYPMLGLSYVFVAFSSWLILGETLSPTRWLGTFVIVLGVALVSKG